MLGEVVRRHQLKNTRLACDTALLRSSGLVNSLKQRCQPQIEQYERCLKANPSNADTCVPLLEKLWVCTEEAFGSPADARSGS